MKIRLIPCLVLCLLLLAAPALADKAPAVELIGSEKAAAHLTTHIYAYTDGWDGYNPSTCPDPGCEEYGHLHCYGVRVKVWDTPYKGSSRVAYYPGGSYMSIGPDTEFELLDVVSYKNKFYANIRVYEDGQPGDVGFVSADYIGCACESYETFEEVYVYDEQHGPFDLR